MGEPYRRQNAVREFAAHQREGEDMALTFKAKGGGGDFKGVPAGSHIAVCDIVADIGIQPGSGMYPAPKPQVYIRFEIPDERVKFQKDGKETEGPAVIGNAYTASMGEKANLRKMIESWRGKRFTDEEAEQFDVSSILGRACMLSVVEKTVGDKTYSNIASVSALPKGLVAPKAELTLLYYDDDNREQLAALPKWIQEKIEKQLEPEQPRYEPDSPEIDDDDDIPF